MNSWADEPAPAVIGADYIAEQNGEEVVVLFVPLEKRLLEGDKEATVSLRRLEDGRLAVLAYTSLDALVAACGNLQPWASMPSDSVMELQSQSGADLVLWDEALPPDQRSDSAPGGTGE